MLVRKKEPIGDALQWTGANTSEVVEFLQGGWKEDGIWLRQLWKGDGIDPDWELVLFEELSARPTDWIIKSEKSNYGLFVVSAERFAEEYEVI